MTRKRVVLLGSIGALVLGGASGAQSLFTGTEQAQLVTGHNAVRLTVEPNAFPTLRNLSWTSTLATSAQNHANKCMFVHSGGVGENLYASTGVTNPRPTPAEIVGSWANERASYTYSSNSCAAGQVCGHYIQMVLRAATQIGCGIAVCTAATSPFAPPFDVFDWHLVVCQYNAVQSSGTLAQPYRCDYDWNGTTTDLCASAIFRDGFESGTRNAWQATTPP